MITKLPDWYRIASIASYNAEILESRSNVIHSIIESKNINWLLDCVRLYLNKPNVSEEFKKEFTSLFLADPLFPIKENDFELRVLAGAIINEHINSNKGSDSVSLAMALMTSSFELKGIINKDIIENSIEFKERKSVEYRKQSQEIIFSPIEMEEEELMDEEAQENEEELIPTTIDELNSKIDDLEDYMLEKLKMFNQVQLLYNKVKVLEEESNIHWWIFRAFSNFKNQPMKELDYHVAPILLALELSDLTTIIPGPNASKQYLKKVIYDNLTDHSKPIIIKDVINKTNRIDKEKIILRFRKSNLGNLCPILYAFDESSKIDNDESWIAYFEKTTGISSNNKIDMIDLAYQFYLENLLVKSLV